MKLSVSVSDQLWASAQRVLGADKGVSQVVQEALQQLVARSSTLASAPGRRNAAGVSDEDFRAALDAARSKVQWQTDRYQTGYRFGLELAGSWSWTSDNCWVGLVETKFDLGQLVNNVLDEDELDHYTTHGPDDWEEWRTYPGYDGDPPWWWPVLRCFYQGWVFPTEVDFDGLRGASDALRDVWESLHAEGLFTEPVASVPPQAEGEPSDG